LRVPASPSNSSAHRFGSYEFEPRAGELRKQGIRIRLEGQPLAILTMLLDRPGELITREELQKRLWPADTFVDFEHSLNAAIKRLRAALNDSASAPRYIETLPGRGYRFRAPLHGAPVATVTTTVGPAESHATSEMPSGLRQWAWRLAVACALMVIALAMWGWRNWRHGSVSGPRPVIRSLAVLPF
jgi:DNA-binding winged helix-turn-helix (wHTH) protein